MDIAYARHYRDLYEHHWWWRAREVAILETLNRLKPVSGWQRILDVGCGDGLFFDQLLSFGEVEGIESSVDLVNPTGVHRHRIHVRPFDATFQPSSPYTLILMLDVLEHLDDPVGALRHAIQLLTPQGVILVTVPAFNLLWTNHDVINHHRTRYTRSTFREIAEKAGFRIDLEQYWFQWTFPVKITAGVIERMLRRRPVPARVPAPWINSALYRWSRLEYRVLNPWNPPFGSSLVVTGGRPVSTASSDSFEPCPSGLASPRD